MMESVRPVLSLISVPNPEFKITNTPNTLKPSKHPKPPNAALEAEICYEQLELGVSKAEAVQY